MNAQEKKYNIGDALLVLAPNSSWVLRNDPMVYTNLEWLEPESIKPTEAEITAEIARLQSEHERTEYQRQRAPEYPAIGDQLDALWKGGEAAAEMLAKVQAVKMKYPKPNNES